MSRKCVMTLGVGGGGEGYLKLFIGYEHVAKVNTFYKCDLFLLV